MSNLHNQQKTSPKKQPQAKWLHTSCMLTNTRYKTIFLLLIKGVIGLTKAQPQDAILGFIFSHSNIPSKQCVNHLNMWQVRYIVQRGQAIPSHEDCGRLHGVGDNSDNSCVPEPQEDHGKLGKQPTYEGRHRHVHRDGGSYSQPADRTRKGRALFEFREVGKCSKQVTIRVTPS